jgi:hypothetical protein
VLTLVERIDRGVKRSPAGCLEWVGYRDPQGYGRIHFQRRPELVHRLAWGLAHGPAGDLCVLHHCDNPPCCDVEHLFLGTRTDNLADMRAKRRGYSPPEGTLCVTALRNKAKTTCCNGHAFTASNTIPRANGSRGCRECHRIANQKYLTRRAEPLRGAAS